MAYSTIQLFKECRILKTKNYVVENISNYLATLPNTYTTKIQYIKQAQQVTVKLDITQDILDGNIDFDTNYNYVAIKNSNDEMTYYYFIIAKRWCSTKSIAFDLSLDVLNTFNGKWSFGKKTKVIREHKDRLESRDVILKAGLSTGTIYSDDWSSIGVSIRLAKLDLQLDAPKNVDLDFEITFGGFIPLNYTYSYNKETAIITINITSNTVHALDISVFWTQKKKRLIRKIDLQSEGITPLVYRDELKDVDIREVYDDNWYLVSKNKDVASGESKPIDTYIVPENNISCNVLQADTSAITASQLTDGVYYYFVDYGLVVRDDEEQFICETKIVDEPNYSDTTLRTSFVIYLDNSKITIKVIQNAYARAIRTHKYTKTITSLDKIYVTGLASTTCFIGSNLTSDIDVFSTYSKDIWSLGDTINIDLWGIDSWDKTDSKLLKIIKLPYIPLNIKLTDDGVSIDGEQNWVYDHVTHSIKLRSDIKYFDKTINAYNYYNPYDELLVEETSSIDTNADRDDKYESKLYHSDYHYHKIVYDANSLPFRLESMNTDDIVFADNMKIRFIVSNAISGRFMFMFPDYVCKNATSDYSNVLNIVRNNEVAIYTSPYLEYIRNGYNYDIKAKNLANAKNIASSLTSIVGGAIGGALVGSSTGPIGLVTGATLGLVQSTINGIASNISAENSIEQKLNQAKNQAVSVSESDDVELMTVYANNRAKLVTYECSDEIKAQLADMFYYFGYISNTTKRPNINSRYWFNFVQCNLDIFRPNNMTDAMYAELVHKYEDGVTILHTHNNEWDFNQVKENWETSIIGG